MWKSETHNLRSEEGENNNVYSNNHIMLQEDVGCACYSLPVMFHAFPVARRENTAVISKTYTAHITGACGRVGLTS